jgi:hypothetical protein
MTGSYGFSLSAIDSHFVFIEDAASKKRGRAQSVEPTPAPKDEVRRLLLFCL